MHPFGTTAGVIRVKRTGKNRVPNPVRKGKVEGWRAVTLTEDRPTDGQTDSLTD